MQDLRDTRIEPLITKFYRGLRANYHFIPYLSARYRGRGGGGPRGPNCQWLTRSPARPRWGKGRGSRGDQALVLTGGGEERGQPELELRRRRSSGLQLSLAAAASAQGQGDGVGAGLGRRTQQGQRLPL
jgi:hypothetical protein